MHLRSLPTMERISVPVRRHPEHYFVVQRSVRLIAIILYQGYNTLKQGLFLIKAVTALLRESHTLNKAVTAVFTSKAAARYKAVIVLRHTTALLRDPYCTSKLVYQVPWYYLVVYGMVQQCSTCDMFYPRRAGNVSAQHT